MLSIGLPFCCNQDSILPRTHRQTDYWFVPLRFQEVGLFLHWLLSLLNGSHSWGVWSSELQVSPVHTIHTLIILTFEESFHTEKQESRSSQRSLWQVIGTVGFAGVCQHTILPVTTYHPLSYQKVIAEHGVVMQSCKFNIWGALAWSGVKGQPGLHRLLGKKKGKEEGREGENASWKT